MNTATSKLSVSSENYYTVTLITAATGGQLQHNGIQKYYIIILHSTVTFLICYIVIGKIYLIMILTKMLFSRGILILFLFHMKRN